MMPCRKNHQHNHRVFVLCLLVIVIAQSAMVAAAQAAETDEKIVIAFAPTWPMPDLLTMNFFRPFEEEYPNVDVVVVDPPTFPYERSEEEAEPFAYLASFAGAADVFAISGLSPIDTRAGLVLDLAPYIAADTEFNMAETFYPKVRNAFQWDGGAWAMPAGWRLGLLGYKPDVFDRASLPYPQADWTWEDFAETMESLMKETGVAPLQSRYVQTPYLAASLAGLPSADSDLTPMLDQAGLRAAYEQLQSARAAGWFAQSDDLHWDQDYAGLLSSYWGAWSSGQRHEFEYTALPGGHTILQIDGFAISSATTHPELSYALTKFLTQRFELVSGYGYRVPARQDIYDQALGSFGYEEHFINFLKVHEALLPYAFDPVESLYVDRLPSDLAQIEDEGIEGILQKSQRSIRSALEAAAAYDARITIKKPPSDYAPIDGITIRFGLADSSPSRLERPLKQYAEAFVREHPDIGRIKIGSLAGSWNLYEDEFDCLYGDEKGLAKMTISSLIRLEPFIEADEEFDLGDFVPAALEKARHQDVLWGYPLTIYPMALRYDRAAFQEQGLPLPSTGWQADEFDRTLRALWSNSEEEKAVLRPSSGNQYLLLLIAANGGFPVDLNARPTSFDLSSAESIEAMRKVLDYARQGISDYANLGPRMTSSIGQLDHAMFIDDLGDRFLEKNSGYDLVSFPNYGETALLSYSVGLGYINAKTAHPEACYDWIESLSRRPDLFGGMPARTNLENSDAVTSAIAPNGAEYFQDLVQQLEDEDRIVFPEADAWSAIRWLNEAFDEVVVNGAPLEAALESAQSKIDSYRECISDASPARRWDCVDKIDAQSASQ